MRARLRPTVFAAALLLFLSVYLFLSEGGVSRTRGREGRVPGFFSLTSIRHLFETELTVPEKVHLQGMLNMTDGCRRLWLKGESLWFDLKFNASLSPLWTQHNKKLPTEVTLWWKTLQNSKIDNISEVISAALQVIPGDDPYHMRDVSRCLRCAVVGNSGNLRNSNYGKLIDAHDFVFRINKAPMAGFSSDVGSKETHRFMYPESFLNPRPNVNFVLMDFKLLDVAWLTSALTNGTITRTYTTVKKSISVSRDKVMIYNPALMHHVHTEWTQKHGRYPSTGHLALFFALQICDEVDLFGYGANKLGNWDHYWKKDDGTHNSFFKKTGVHDSNFEQSIMENLRKADKIKIYPGVR
ncbi:CMP-N-acetylneuraminate-beta-galactosamide-alpha-2,3-sialyltransferase 2-like [Acanthaster planci]|uniref:CMP-N-acetylneuraminate-beta-galactosamide-alpha-2,3-sialyltransferase 2 n=1 Tax=Acanthaster planci TaxID=133434 RepID=A0A8B7YT15_ACAPL|nr:CMP-N-acetylneuraminate-beta-galactosamide-alpha-2,3-sialyltransferase 2-like [Acanthaster planci]XP_022094495.1 CMP-N-acetylneuraminate-beta-galactosamide-alpha-2,3-sialyltransferase 2-like [Acanthaster planci]XP_022094496.1 CMP-N-acetylneuraminate-beta-galactosamide-alpha-2,3-sialyltransferase 2-like [Acanthaster planci]XP_022094497.1 CMP-N-acetylneuraminate-beta-galactosamide-alpha-2,3-sialyltransferase 2-like [Acanthaster planci]XP_022094499.1 CMP-N-acetylneuraminate-beta-galactosamide-a